MILDDSLIHNEFLGNMGEMDNLEFLRKRKRYIILRHHLSIKRNREGQNVIVVGGEIHLPWKQMQKKCERAVHVTQICGCEKHVKGIMSRITIIKNN